VLNESLRSTLRYDSNFTNEGYTCRSWSSQESTICFPSGEFSPYSPSLSSDLHATFANGIQISNTTILSIKDFTEMVTKKLLGINVNIPLRKTRRRRKKTNRYRRR